MRLHSTRTRYQRHGCRCEACTDANNAYLQRYRDGMPADEAGWLAPPAELDRPDDPS